MKRSEFISKSMLGAGCIFCIEKGMFAGTSNLTKSGLGTKEAMFYSVTPRGVKCLICPSECTLKTGEMSTCRNRVNKADKLYTAAYGNPCAAHIDPIEKKPLFHFYPGSHAFSIATAGCNFGCLNCQNWTISQKSPSETENIDLPPKNVVQEALSNNCKSIAYTYSEPTTFYEYVYDTSLLAKEKGIKNVFVSNGYINPEPLKKLCNVIDAANIDLKSFSDDIYLRLNAGKLQPILNTLKTMKDEGVWLEITNLVIPSWTDDVDMIKRMCDWLVTNDFSNVPLHFSRFQPLYKLTQLPATPLNTLIKARETAIKAGCNFVYIGNVPGLGSENTVCPSCKSVVFERRGFAIVRNGLSKGKCGKCNAVIPGRW